ncbi:MAG: haloacid dehalogenase-like hydrolase [Candidatus Moraniibacteriota bacterium]
MGFHKGYKTIFFDWHNTLSTSLFWDQWKDPEHPRHEWHTPLSQYLFGENMPVVMDWMRGRVNAEEISEMLSDRFGHSRGIIFRDLKESCESMRLVSDEILPLVQKLRENGTRCVIATDNMDTFTRFAVPAMRLSEHFDGIINSFERGVLKQDIDEQNPDRIPFFDEYLKENNLRCEDVVLIDDCIYKSGVYERMGFEILQIFSPDDFVGKLKQLA